MEKVQISPQSNLETIPDLLHSIHLGSIRLQCDFTVHFHTTQLLTPLLMHTFTYALTDTQHTTAQLEHNLWREQ